MRPVTDRVRWGILSTGHIARKFVEDLRRSPDAEVVAVGSRTEGAARAFADRHRIARAHDTWQALAADPDIDVIYVATPATSHFAATMTCLEAGKPVLVEKPFTVDLDSAAKLVETARSNKVFAMEAMWTRCFPVVRAVAGLVADRAIGDVMAVHADFGMSGPFPPGHRMRSRNLGGGALMDLGVYPVTLAHLILGPPDTVHATGRLADGVDEHTAVCLGYEGGAYAQISCSLIVDTGRRAFITGTTGRIELPRDFHRPNSYDVWHGEAPTTTRVPHDGWGYHFEAAEVHRCLREGLTESLLVPLADTLDVMQTLDLIREQIGINYP